MSMYLNSVYLIVEESLDGRKPIRFLFIASLQGHYNLLFITHPHGKSRVTERLLGAGEGDILLFSHPYGFLSVWIQFFPLMSIKNIS